ncbi:MAG: hypothetical protein VB934_14035 [Polyangiaceae bacterium]
MASDVVAAANRHEGKVFALGVRKLRAKRTGAFGPRSGKPLVLTSSGFSPQTIGAVSFAQALGNPVVDRAGPRDVIEKP